MKPSEKYFKSNPSAKRAWITSDDTLFPEAGKSDAQNHQWSIDKDKPLEEVVNPKFATEIKESASEDEKLEALTAKEETLNTREIALNEREQSLDDKAKDQEATEARLAEERSGIDKEKANVENYEKLVGVVANLETTLETRDSQINELLDSVAAKDKEIADLKKAAKKSAK